MPTRPIAVPLFGTDPANAQDIVEPTELIRQGGWLPNDRPAAPHVNWQFRQLGDWVDFLRSPNTSNWVRFSFPIGTTVDAAAVDGETTEEGTPTPNPIRRLLTIQTLSGTARLYASSRGDMWRDIASGDPIETSIPTTALFIGDRWIVGTTTNGKIYWTYPSGALLGASAIDEAAAWVASTIPAGGEPVVAMATDGGSLIASVSNTKILYSTDKGVTFTEATQAGAPRTDFFTSVVFDGVAWLAVTGDGEIFRTTLISGSWTREATTIGAGDWRLRTDTFNVVAFDYLGAGFDLYLSTDNGVSFAALTLPSAVNDSFAGIIDLQYHDAQWVMLHSGVPSLSANNDITNVLGWTGLIVPYYSDSSTSRTIVFVDGAVHLFYERYVLRSLVAQSTAPGPWAPLNAPAPLHDAAYLRGRLVTDTAPTAGDAVVWDDVAEQWEPGVAPQRHVRTAVDYNATSADFSIGVTSVAAIRNIVLPAPAASGGTQTRVKAFRVKNESGAATNAIKVFHTVVGMDFTEGAVELLTATACVVVYCDGTDYFVESQRA